MDSGKFLNPLLGWVGAPLVLTMALMVPCAWLGLPAWAAPVIALAVVGSYRVSRLFLTSERQPDVGREGFLSILGATARVRHYYVTGLERALRWVDRWIGDDTVSRRGTAVHAWWRDWWWGDACPWTHQSYDWCLRLALIYPIGGMLITWMGVGAGTLGGVTLLGQGTGMQRAIMGVALAVSTAALIYAIRASGRKFWTAFAVAVAGAGAGAFALAGAFAVAFAGAGAFAVAGAGAFAGAVAGAFAVAVAFAFAGAGAVAMAEASKRGHAGIALMAEWFILITGLVAALWAAAAPVGSGVPLALLFLGYLPLVNAPLDWLSLGLTRGLLREAWLRGRSWGLLYSVLDLATALVCMFLLILLAVAAIRMANWAATKGGGAPLLDLPAVLAGLRADPGGAAHYWVYFMFLSTLIPTVVHAGLAVVGGATGAFASLGFVARSVRAVVQQPEGHKDTVVRWVAPAAIAAIVGAFILGLILATIHLPLLYDGFVWYGGRLLDFAEWVVRVGA